MPTLRQQRVTWLMLDASSSVAYFGGIEPSSSGLRELHRTKDRISLLLGGQKTPFKKNPQKDKNASLPEVFIFQAALSVSMRFLWMSSAQLLALFNC